MNKNFLNGYIPAIVWASFILILTSIPTLSAPSLGIDFEDKLYHFIVYFVFGLLLARAGMQRQNSRMTVGLFYAFLMGTTFGVLDELHQTFIPGRTCDFWDATADAIGILAGVLVFKLTSTFFFQKEKLLQDIFNKNMPE